MKLKKIAIAIVVFTLTSCNGQPSKKVETLDAVSFSKKIEATPNPQILDVRTPEEFAAEHIERAQNVNWLSNDFVTNASKFDKSKPVFVYCKIGGRSHQAAEKLAQLGFTQIIELEGGFLKWDAAGLSKPSAKRVGISKEQYATLLNSDKKVLIDFYAEWCAPCKKMTPYLLKMEKELGDKLVIIRLDADKNKSLLSEMKISELPTLLLYENKQLKWQHSGYISESDLKKQL
ncbi:MULTISPECIES: thioredoxin domain-containing protein [Flavobacterium]|uniref:Thioredoxin domain-containing protein n=1 Tax=Flavobacterium keumense TaxID=1306518 RepID=A0ABY8N7L1_9FLAO|nr:MULTISPECIES: thioredoxin domain-containing protein [Flavobacterium]WGK94586.1 thioredoxin domain-containing protein [Flavobacterium keumense]